MPYKPREIEQVLQGKFAFSPARGHSSDHRWYELRLPGLPTILTKVSHSRKEIGHTLAAKIARQLKVNKPFFDGMMDCTQSSEDYHRRLQEDIFP